MLENKFNADGFFCVHSVNENGFLFLLFYGNMDFKCLEWNFSEKSASKKSEL